MPLRDDLLTPISEDSPGGVSLQYDPLFDRVKEARREDPDLPPGELPEGPRKVADYGMVQRLAEEALATKTKDLQLAVWLTEALLHREGYGGLAQGLGLLRDLLADFWEVLYPELEDGDAEPRAAKLDWRGSHRLVLAARTVPLTAAGYGYLRYEESRDVGYESAARESDDRMRRRQAKIAEGKLAAEDWDRAVDQTDVAVYQRLAAELDAATAALDALDAVAQERFGDVAPDFRPLRDVLEQVRAVPRAILARRLPQAPATTGVGASDGPAAGNGAAAGPAGALPAGGHGDDGLAVGVRRRAAGGPSLQEQAAAELRAGRAARAVELLMSAARRGRSRRDRFLRRTTVARIMVDASLYGVATPLLEQLVAEIEEFKLEEWEPGEVVATPLALLWRCYDRTDVGGSIKENLYLRICRLDPVQAIALAPAGG
jgi:type VI secretion system protein ImpA